MNKKMVLSALGLVALSSSIALAFNGPGDGVVGSVHDMNLYTDRNVTQDSQGRVCAFCHTPHHAITSDTETSYLPLWSHILPTGGYSAYDSATIDASITAATMMEGPSKLCMSCHDGAIAVDTHYSTTNNGTLTLDSDAFGGGGAAIAKTSSLSNDHPIGFVYDDVAGGSADGTPGSTTDKDNYIKASTATFKGNPTITIASRLFTKEGGSPIMTCATCHDVHNKKNVDVETATNYLLLSPNNNSDICLSCHIK